MRSRYWITTASIPDIISEQSLDNFSIVETWVEPEDIAIRAITPDGFVCVDSPRTQDVSGDRLARGGGVALVFRAAFHYRKLDFDLNPQTFEFLAVMLTLGSVRTLVVTVYRPDGRNNAFYGEFESLLEMIAVYNCNFIILGDVNIHLDVNTDPASKKFSSIVDSFGFRQMVETATYRAGHLARHRSRWQRQIGQDINPLRFPITLSLRTNYRCAILHRSLSMRQHGSGRILIEKHPGRVWRTVFSVPRRMPGVGCQSTICRRRIRPYWRHSSINSLHAWLLKNTTDRSHHGSTPSVVLRNGSRVALSEPTVAPGWFRIEPSGLISFHRPSWSISGFRTNTGRCLLRTAQEMPESSGTLCHP